MKRITVSTRNINQAAMLTALGGELMSVDAIYPNNSFVIATSPFALWYERHVGLIPYRKYCNQRIRLKERGRKKASLPENFVGRKAGYEFGAIARLVPWTKKERDKYGIVVDKPE